MWFHVLHFHFEFHDFVDYLVRVGSEAMNHRLTSLLSPFTVHCSNMHVCDRHYADEVPAKLSQTLLIDIETTDSTHFPQSIDDLSSYVPLALERLVSASCNLSVHSLDPIVNSDVLSTRKSVLTTWSRRTMLASGNDDCSGLILCRTSDTQGRQIDKSYALSLRSMLKFIRTI